MKKLMVCVLLCFNSVFSNEKDVILAEAPPEITCVKEIAVGYNKLLPALYNSLTPQERVFAYYLFRASLPGDLIYADQNHRYSVDIIQTFEDIVRNEKALLNNDDLQDIDIDKCIKDAKIFLVYLWTNHGVYFQREQANQKRTPGMLDLKCLTQDRLTRIVAYLYNEQEVEKKQQWIVYLFDENIERNLVTPGSIDKSVANYYATNFTDGDFEKLAQKDKKPINAYYYIKNEQGEREPEYELYKIGGKYHKELTVCLYWLEKALEHAKKYPAQFDENLIKSLEYLCAFIKTGDEELFKKHSIAWVKSNSRLDYNFGFIEVYKDPKSYRGMFQSEVTIKSMDISALNKILPHLEVQLPFPEEFKRQNLTKGTASLPNASINTIICNHGHLGPLSIVAAYCLPNYADIRSEHGSKQIIYEKGKGIAETLNPDISHRLFNCQEYVAWAQEYDPEFELDQCLWKAHVILHETLGHGSGRSAKHVFVEGENRNIDGKSYQIGEQVQVTSENVQTFLAGYFSAIEEMRADIIALYSSILCSDEMADAGMFGQWPKKLSKEKMIELIIRAMARDGLRRLLAQQDDAQEIAGAHAICNTTITNYLLDHGGIELIKESIIIDNKNHAVLDIRVYDQEKTIQAIHDLACLVQKIKSTGDGVAARNLIETYGKPVRHPEHIKIMKENRQAVIGDIKVQAVLWPDFKPTNNNNGDIVDIKAIWPASIYDQYMRYANMRYSCK